MECPQLARFTDLALLLLRLMVGLIFIASGWNDLKDPAREAKTLEWASRSRFFWVPRSALGESG
jgi:putative oxidoreductase